MDDVWGQYCTRINGGILFHSVWYYEKDPSTLSNVQYNKLGTICSHGCVRLNVQDAKWIYDNCPVGTTVIVYDSNDPGPLGKPQTIKVPTTSRMGYDPTDIWSKGNPYIKKKPVISGAKNRTITKVEKVDILSGVTAKTSTGTDGTSLLKASIQYNGKTVKKVDPKKSGIYKVTYQIKDLLGKTAKKTVTYTVKGDMTKPKLSGVEDIITNSRDKISRELALKNVKALWKDKELSKDNIEVKITDTEDKGIYQVDYVAVAANGMEAKASAVIYVDSDIPSFTGIEDKEIPYGTKVSREYVLEDVEVYDEFTYLSKDDIQVTISEDKDNGQYEITYQVTDAGGNTGKAGAVYKVIDPLRIEGAKDKIIPKGLYLNEFYALSQGIKAFDGEQELTGRLTAEIKETEKDVYQIVFTVVNDAGRKKEVTVTYTRAE